MVGKFGKREVRWQQATLDTVGKVVHGNGIDEAKRADAGTHEAREVADGAKGNGDVAGERADVGAFRAGDLERERFGVRFQKDQGVDGDGARVEVEVATAARDGVGALAVDSDGRVLGGRLLDRAAETGEGRLQIQKRDGLS